MNRELLKNSILSSLQNSAENFGILHTEIMEGKLDRHAPSVDDVIQMLLELVDQGLLVMRHPEQPTDEYWREATDQYAKWLESARPEGALFQEYGPWFELTEKGRAELPADD